jgi:aminopeptidase N
MGMEFKKGENPKTQKLRTELLSLAVWCEQDKALKFILEKFKNSKKPEDINSNIRGIVYSAGARWGGKEAYEKLFKIYKNTHSAEERSSIAAGMAATKDEEIVKKLLSHIKDPELVKPQDIASWFVHLIRKSDSRELTWVWLVKEWDWLEKRFKGDKTYDAFPRYASAFLFGEKWLEKYKEFFEPKVEQPGLRRAINVGIEDIKSRTAWYERDEHRLRQYLL